MLSKSPQLCYHALQCPVTVLLLSSENAMLKQHFSKDNTTVLFRKQLEEEVMRPAHLPTGFNGIVIGLTEFLDEGCLVLLGYT